MAIKWSPEQEKSIYQKDKNIIVSAGAGSGKSTVLTERIKQKLLAKEISSLDEILVLTFTNASAADLKRKIKTELNNCQETKEFAKTVDSANISTFDSYALLLVKKYANKLKITKEISIVDSTVINIKKREIIDEIMANEFKNLDNDFKDFASTFFVKSDYSFENYILNLYEKLNLRLDKKEYLNNYFIKYFNKDFFDAAFLEFEKKIKSLHNDAINYYYDVYIPQIEDKLTDGVFDKLVDLYSNFINAKTYDDLALIFKEKFSHIQLHKKTSKEYVYNDDVKPFHDIFKEKVNDVASFFEEYEDYKTEKENYYSTEKYLKVIIRILSEFDNKLDEYKERLAIYEFSDIAKKLINLLIDNPDIKQEVAENYNEILIDEYQDTSDLQEAFVSLISCKNVYMVGDIKQSIYRFRNANPSIFKNKYDHYLSIDDYNNFENSLINYQTEERNKKLNKKGIKIDLKDNYRSRGEVVETINTIFNKVMKDELGGAKYKEEHQMVQGRKEYNKSQESNYQTEILNYQYIKESEFSKAETEIRIMAKDILNKVNNGFRLFDKTKDDVITSRPATFKDFAIISRSADHYELIAKIFKEYGIDTLIHKNEKINSSSLLYTLKSILILAIKLYRFKVNNENIDTQFKHAFISVARSFIFEYSDDNILEIFKTNSFLTDKIVTSIEKIALEISCCSLREVFENILYEYNYYEKLSKLDSINENLVRTEFFAKLCDNLEILNLKQTELIEYLETMLSKDSKAEIVSNMKDINAVTVMTIHKSKGLEFPIVYIPFLDKNFNSSDIKARFVYDEQYGIISPFYKEGFKNVITKELFKINYNTEAISEEIRIFYVALTRAKEKLVMLLEGELENNISGLKITSYKKLLSAVGDSLNKYIVDYDCSDIKPSENHNNSRKSTNTIEKNYEVKPQELKGVKVSSSRASKSSKGIIDKKSYQNMQLGLHIHEILEYIDYDNPDDILKNENDWVKNKINDFLNSFIFDDKDNTQYYREYAFTFKDENNVYNGIIDLLVETPNEVYIVDYKLKNVEDDEYVKQLSVYHKYLSTKTNKPISAYLYSIIDGEIKKINLFVEV